jgi:uncharacterized repeat protein (TIGR01451 family)
MQAEMRMKRIRKRRAAQSLGAVGAAVALLALVVTVLAAGERLPRSLVGSGGGRTTTGSVTLRSAIAQPVAGVVRDGIGLCSGFLCGAGTLIGPVDSIPPAITATQPGDGESDVPLNRFLDVFFSEAMDTASVGVTITPGLTLTPTWSAFDTRLTLLHAGLVTSTRYTATVSAGRDPAGNSLVDAPYTWTFTTGITTAQEVDLALAKGIAGSGVVTAGERISYTFTITNYGPTTPVSATLVDTFNGPSGLAGISGPGCSWAPGSSAVSCALAGVDVTTPMSFTLVVTTHPDFDGQLVNNAAIAPAGAVLDTNPANDSAGPVTVIVNLLGRGEDVYRVLLPVVVR